jgi:hypothetical protein
MILFGKAACDALQETPEELSTIVFNSKTLSGWSGKVKMSIPAIPFRYTNEFVTLYTPPSRLIPSRPLPLNVQRSYVAVVSDISAPLPPLSLNVVCTADTAQTLAKMPSNPF